MATCVQLTKEEVESLIDLLEDHLDYCAKDAAYNDPENEPELHEVHEDFIRLLHKLREVY